MTFERLFDSPAEDIGTGKVASISRLLANDGKA